MMESSAKGFSTGHYGYGLLERALGAVLGVGEDVQRGALRSRLKRLAQLGLPAPQPGLEGRRLYSMEECHQLLTALLLGNIVHDPAIVVPAVNRMWKSNLRKGAIAASQEASRDKRTQNPFEGNPHILHAAVRIVTEPWRTGDPDTALRFVRLARRYPKWEATVELAKKHGMTFAEVAHSENLLVQEFEALRPVEWSANLNYTDAVDDLHKALHRD
jgi:hypothetical protein